MARISESVIEKKAKALKSRKWKVALLAAASAAIPVPFLSTGIDFAVVLEEVLFYRSQFALDDDSLEKNAKMVGVSLETLKKNVKFHMNLDLSLYSLSVFITKRLSVGASNQIAKYTLPVVGSVISCYASFSSIYNILEEILDMMKYDALRVLLYVERENDKQIDHLLNTYSQ